MSDGLVQRLYAKYVDDGDCLALEAADRLKQYREALEAIQVEAERENGSWVHLKRVIGINARKALQVQP